MHEERKNRESVSIWVQRHAARLTPQSNVLDVACGKGRHSRYLARLGHRITAIDIDLSDVIGLEGKDAIEFLEHDLESSAWPFTQRRFDGIVITNYLHRPLLPHLVSALAPGGVVIYDTFAAGNERFGRPRNPAFLLEPGELLYAFAGDLRIVAYDHGCVNEPRPAIRQRLCAVRDV